MAMSGQVRIGRGIVTKKMTLRKGNTSLDVGDKNI